MADSKQFMEVVPADAELLKLLQETRNDLVSDDQLREQRVSFAFGNALNSEAITKDSVRRASEHVRLISQ